VQKWISGLDCAPASVRKIHRVLSLVLAWAVKDGRLVRNPAADVTLPRPQEEEQLFLTHEQLDELAERCGPAWRRMVLFLGYTGLRWGEMAALRVGRLDLDRRRAMITESVTPVSGEGLVWGTPKMHERRAVPIPPFLVGELRQHVAGLRKDDLVFRGPRGAVAQSQKFQHAALTDAAIAMQLCDFVPDPKRPGELVAVNVMHPHQLRHTAASLAIAAGADIKVVQQMLGHKDAAMTLNRYGHLFGDRLDVVADAMDAARSAALGSRVLPVSPKPELRVVGGNGAS
jgi:integrase